MVQKSPTTTTVWMVLNPSSIMGYENHINWSSGRISEPSTVGGDFIFEGFHLDSYETVGFHSTKMPSSPWSCQKKTQKKPIGLRKITIAFWNPRLKSMEKHTHTHVLFIFCWNVRIWIKSVHPIFGKDGINFGRCIKLSRNYHCMAQSQIYQFTENFSWKHFFVFAVLKLLGLVWYIYI